MAKMLSGFDGGEVSAADFERVVCPSAPTRAPLPKRRRFRRALAANPPALLCLIVFALIAAASLAAPLLPLDPDLMDVTGKMAAPSAEHWLGTDELGRDSFTRAIYGGRVSLTVGFAAMLVSVALGTTLGTLSGYAGGRTDAALMRLVDIVQSVPSLLLIIIVFAFVPANMLTLVLMLAMFSWTGVARIVRAQTLALKEQDFVAAARRI